eukprot:gene25393-biopygen16495
MWEMDATQTKYTQKVWEGSIVAPKAPQSLYLKETTWFSGTCYMFWTWYRGGIEYKYIHTRHVAAFPPAPRLQASWGTFPIPERGALRRDMPGQHSTGRVTGTPGTSLGEGMGKKSICSRV